jgi:hypothetical protein
MLGAFNAASMGSPIRDWLLIARGRPPIAGAGAEFIAENGGGPGVRLRKP